MPVTTIQKPVTIEDYPLIHHQHRKYVAFQRIKKVKAEEKSAHVFLNTKKRENKS